MIAWAAFSALFLSACSMPSIKQPVDVNTFYKRDMMLLVNGVSGQGVVMVPKADTYQISGRSAGNIDLLSMRTNHREIIQEAVGRTTFAQTYIPVIGIEDKTEDSSPSVMEVAAFDKGAGQNAWGLIDFEDPDGVVATVKCNGSTSMGNSTICQAPAGLIQEIDFSEDMRNAADAGSCNYGGIPKIGRKFQYVMPPRKCELIFTTMDGSRTHRHVSIGYEQVLLRKE